MVREKTRLELVEELSGGAKAMADRFREALFVISQLEELDEAKKVARAAMMGELHGHERVPQQAVGYSQPPFTTLVHSAKG